MNGYYQLIEGHAGGFVFTLRAGNHETIFQSRIYWSRQAALDAVDTVRQRSQCSDCFVRCEPVDGMHFFELHDEQGRMVGRSLGCGSRAGVAAGIASVRRHAPATQFRGLVRRALVPG